MRRNALLSLIIVPLALVACKEGPKPKPKPEADFTFEKHPLGQVFFTNTSKNATSYRWDFGDGRSSVEPDPIWGFPYKRAYQVTLEVKGEGGTHSVKKTVDLNILPADQTAAILNQLAGSYRFTKEVKHRVNHPGPNGGVWDDVLVINRVGSFRARNGILGTYDASDPSKGTELDFRSAYQGSYYFKAPCNLRCSLEYIFYSADSVRYTWFNGSDYYNSNSSTLYGKKIP